MNAIQIPFLVEAILIVIAMIFGTLLGKAKKPYGKVKLVAHLFFVLWFATGFGFIVYSLSRVNLPVLTWVLVGSMGLMILVQLTTGIVMLAAKQTLKRLPVVHITAASILLLCDIAALILSGTP